MSPMQLRCDGRQHGRRGRLYAMNGTCEKLSNQLCLTRCGFYVHLEEDGHFYSNMSMYGRLAERNNCPSSQTKLLRSLAFAAMLLRSRNDACEAVWQVSSRSQHPATVVYFKGHGPWGCQGQKGFKGSLRGSWLHRSNKLKVLTSFKGPKTSWSSL